MTHEELILKAKEAKSAEELFALAKENNMNLTAESAAAYFEQMHKIGELDDDDLDNVAGGACYHDGKKVVTVTQCCTGWKCDRCGGKTFKEIGDGFTRIHTCPDGHKPGMDIGNVLCDTCGYCKYEDALWLCYHPANCK